MAVLADRYGRNFPYLRLSLLEACNFRCTYCLPDGYQANGKPRWLTREEISRLLRGFAAVGLRKLRLTGGEPSLRTDLADIIAAAAATPGIETVAMTTNGILLRRHIERWRDAGLNAVNVSLDSLDPQRFHAITGHDRGLDILSGIDCARSSSMRSCYAG
jgi:cyclic pyranopterin phosphate synthase